MFGINRLTVVFLILLLTALTGLLTCGAPGKIRVEYSYEKIYALPNQKPDYSNFYLVVDVKISNIGYKSLHISPELFTIIGMYSEVEHYVESVNAVERQLREFNVPDGGVVSGNLVFNMANELSPGFILQSESLVREYNVWWINENRASLSQTQWKGTKK